MVRMTVTCRQRLERFGADERGGERDTLTTLLILALIIVPLIILISQFGEGIIDSANDAWDAVMGAGLTVSN